jgi:hypothetical protein
VAQEMKPYLPHEYPSRNTGPLPSRSVQDQSPKTVRFNVQPDIRYFYLTEKTRNVSASISQFHTGIDSSNGQNNFKAPFQWDAIRLNFQSGCLSIQHQTPVSLGDLKLCQNRKQLIGSVIVHNIAFQKCVSCRFTFDNWETISEVSATYSGRCHISGIHDYFTFSIDLARFADFKDKTLDFCLRYTVAGEEFWDNNNCLNYRLGFKKLGRKNHGSFGQLPGPDIYIGSDSSVQNQSIVRAEQGDKKQNSLKSRYDLSTSLSAAAYTSNDSAEKLHKPPLISFPDAKYESLINSYCFVRICYEMLFPTANDVSSIRGNPKLPFTAYRIRLPMTGPSPPF